MADLEIKMEKIRGELNELMKNREDCNYNEILDISIKLDKLIYKYYISLNTENRRKCTE